MNRTGVITLLLAALLFITACDNDDGVSPITFSLTIEVVDGDGVPVPGLDMSLAANIPYYQDNAAAPSKAAVIIPFSAAEACSLHIFIEDVTGSNIRILGSHAISAGQHRLMWNGNDDAGIHLASGVYTAHYVALHPVTNDTLYDGRVSMYMGLIDTARLDLGPTDVNGRIVLTDKRLFPHLYDVPVIKATNELAEEIGTINLTNSMRFGFHDPINGGSMRFYEDVTGPGTLQFVWTGKMDSDESVATVTPLFDDKIPIPIIVFDLGLPFPCPFN